MNISHLEFAIKEALNFNVSLFFRNGEIIINGLESKLDELQVCLFIQGYIYGLKNKKPTLKIHEAG